MDVKTNHPWKRVSMSRLVLIFYVLWFPMRFYFGVGFANPTADYFLGFVTVFAPLILLAVLPYKSARWNILGPAITLLILLLIAFVPVIFFQIAATPDALNSGRGNPALELQTRSKVGLLTYESVYVSNCGATCSYDTYKQKEFILLGVKIRIPRTTVDLPN